MCLFSRSNILVCGYFDPEAFFYVMKVNDFWGDLTDISAKKKALVFVHPSAYCNMHALSSAPTALLCAPLQLNFSTKLVPVDNGNS